MQKDFLYKNFKHLMPNVAFLKKVVVEASDKPNIYHSQFKTQIKISLIDTNFQFVKTDHLEKLLGDQSQNSTNGLLGFDENFRLIVYGQKSTYPVVGFWTKGIDLGSVFLKNQMNDRLRESLWILFMKHARSDAFNKVTFSDKKIKFIFVPFTTKGSNPPILLVEMGNLKDTVTTDVIKNNPTHQIEESILIHQSLQIKKSNKRSSNFKLWDNFLTKNSVKTELGPQQKLDLKSFEDRIDKLSLEFDRIEKLIQSDCSTDTDDQRLKTKVFNHSGQYLEEEYLKSESDVQNSNYPHQFQRLLQQQSSRQLFTGRSIQSNQKTTCVKFMGNNSNEIFLQSKKDTQTKFSPQKKLKNSIYDTLNQTNKWLSSEGKRLSMGQLSQREVNSFYEDVPQIKSCQQ